jgi:ferredoxin-NADP reductase
VQKVDCLCCLQAEAGVQVQVQVGGDFLLTHADMQRPLLFLAGGIGITPMMSMLLHYVEMVQAANNIITGLHQYACNGSTC